MEKDINLNQLRGKEIAVCGIKPVNYLAEFNTKAIKRLYFNAATAPSYKKLSSELAGLKKIYRLVTDEELTKIAASSRHGGVVAIIDLPKPDILDNIGLENIIKQKKPMIVLDNVGNPNNTGAIVRSAAYFGFNNIILSGNSAGINQASYRVSEGGMEFVRFYTVKDLKTLSELSKGRLIMLGASLNGKTQLRDIDSKIVPNRHPCLLFGNEETGLTKTDESFCDILVKIEGSKQIDSLNVSVAASLFLYELSNYYK